jgi:hypothetical protein
MPIDYARMQKSHPKLKAMLTRAQKADISVRYDKVKAACIAAVREWEAVGAWVDDWSRWQRALIDAGNEHSRNTGVYINVPRLEDLR